MKEMFQEIEKLEEVEYRALFSDLKEADRIIKIKKAKRNEYQDKRWLEDAIAQSAAFAQAYKNHPYYSNLMSNTPENKALQSKKMK